MSNELAKQISYILYSSPEEDVKVMALVKDETIWLTQKAMAELFDCSQDNIGLHLKKCVWKRRIGKESNCRGNLGSSKRRVPFRKAQCLFLQSRCDNGVD
jgi:hypothetical protein